MLFWGKIGPNPEGLLISKQVLYLESALFGEGLG